MAYGQKYRIQIDTKDGVHSYDIRLKKKSYVGSSSDREIASLGLKFAYGADGKNENSSAMPSSCKIRVRDPNKTLQAEIFGADEREWIADILRDGAPFWIGFAKTDVWGESPDEGEYTAEMTFLCGLKLLEGENYDNAGTPYTGRISVKDGLVRSLMKVGVDLGVTSTRIYANWYPYHQTADITGDPLAAVRFSQDWFAETTGAVFKARRVANELCGRMQVRVVQVLGRWYAVQVGGYSGANFTTENYDSAGSSTGTEAVAAVSAVTIGAVGGTNAGELLRGANFDGKLSYQRGKISYDHAVKEDLFVANGGFEDVSGSDPDFWTESESGAGGSYAEGFDSSKSLYFTSIDYDGVGDPADQATKYRKQTVGWILPGTQLEFTAKIRAHKDDDAGEGVQVNDRRSRPVFWALWGQKFDGNYEYWDDENEVWTPSVTPGGKKNRLEAYPMTWSSIKRIISAPTVELNLELDLYEGVDTIDLGSSYFEIDRFLWDKVDIDVIVAGKASAESSTLLLTNTDSNNSQEVDLGKTLLGDGPSDNHMSRLTVLDGSDEIPTTGWKLGAYSAEASTDVGLDYFSVRRALVRGSGPRRRLTCTLRLKGTADYLPHQAFVYDGINYICVSYRLDAIRRRISLDLVEIDVTSNPTIIEDPFVTASSLSAAAGVTIDVSTGLGIRASEDLVAITKQSYAVGSTLTEFDVDPLTQPIQKGQYLVVKPPDGGFVVAKTSAAAAIGAIQIPIESQYLAKTLRYPASIAVSNFSIFTGITATREAIRLIVGGTPTTTAAATYGSGTRTSISITALGYPLDDDQKVRIEPASGAAAITLTVNGDHEIGDETLTFDSATFAVTIGDPIYADGIVSRGSLSVESDRIDAVIKRTGEQIGTLNAAYNGARTTISIANLTDDVKKGDTLILQQISSGQDYEVTVDADASSGNPATVTIVSQSITVDVGDPVLAGAIVALRLGFDGIVAQAPVMRSSNFDGTFDASWNITARGTTGWAVTKTGHLAATNVLLSGSIVITGGSGIANLTDAGAAVTWDDASDVVAGGGKSVPLTNQFQRLDTVGDFWGAVYPNGISAPTGAGAGLYMAADYMGYYSGSAWNAFIKSSGQFLFQKDASNYIRWNGTTFQIQAAAGGLVMDENGFDVVMDSGFTTPIEIKWDDGATVHTILQFKHITVSSTDVAQLLNPTGIISIVAGTDVGGETDASITMYPSGTDGALNYDVPVVDVQGQLDPDVYSGPGIHIQFAQATRVTILGSNLAETTLVSATNAFGSKTVPLNRMKQTGSTFRITCRGTYSRLGGETTRTGVLKIKFGSTVVGTFSVSLGNTAVDDYWEASLIATVSNAGATEKVWAQGYTEFEDDGRFYDDNTAEISVPEIGSTNTIDVTFDWAGLSDALDRIDMTNCVYELLAQKIA